MRRRSARAGCIAAILAVATLAGIFGVSAIGPFAIGTPAYAQSGDSLLGRDVLLSRFDGRDYLLVWPSETPTGILILLHDVQARAFAIEARDGLIDSAAAYTERRNMALLIPSAAPGGCEAVDNGAAQAIEERVLAGGDMLCWRLGEGLTDEMRHLRRLTASIARGREVEFGEPDLIGYGRGGDFVVQALRDGQLSVDAKLGVIAGARFGAQPGDSGDDFPQKDARPRLYIEAADGDARTAAGAAVLIRALLEAEYGARLCARAVMGGARYDGARFASFLDWFDQPCRPEAEGDGAREGEDVEGEAEGGGDDS